MMMMIIMKMLYHRYRFTHFLCKILGLKNDSVKNQKVRSMFIGWQHYVNDCAKPNEKQSITSKFLLLGKRSYCGNYYLVRTTIAMQKLLQAQTIVFQNSFYNCLYHHCVNCGNIVETITTSDHHGWEIWAATQQQSRLGSK